MKITVFVIVALLVLAPVALAESVGSSFGSLTTAQTAGKGQTSFNGLIGLADYTSFGGAFGFGLSDKMDARLKIGMLDVDYFDNALVLGADMKYQIWNLSDMSNPLKDKPFDMAVGGFFEWASWDSDPSGFIDSQSVFQIGAHIIGSKTFQMSNNTTLTPYGRLNLRNETISISFASQPGFPGGDASDSHISVGLNGGVAWGVSQQIALYGELQIDGNDGLFLGMDYHP